MKRFGMKSTRSIVEMVVLLVIGAVLLGTFGGIYFVTAGVSARPTPGRVETLAARTVRSLAISMRTRGLVNPVPASADAIAEGRDHFADHCAVCHGNDGSGNTEMGRGLYPKSPDMRLAATQNLSDADLFYIIENGVRLTGMPGWGTGTRVGEEQSWHLVHFIRHLPEITPEEIEQMEALNPKSPGEIRQQIEEEQFLQGSGDSEPVPSAPTHEHTGAHQ
jgi:mono/diheme cytochrome c family protein